MSIFIAMIDSTRLERVLLACVASRRALVRGFVSVVEEADALTLLGVLTNRPSASWVWQRDRVSRSQLLCPELGAKVLDCSLTLLCNHFAQTVSKEACARRQRAAHAP